MRRFAVLPGSNDSRHMVRDAGRPEYRSAPRRYEGGMHRIIVSPHVGCKGGRNLTAEIKLQFARDRTEFDWRFRYRAERGRAAEEYPRLSPSDGLRCPLS